MEILFVSHKYPPSTGGMEKQSYELITGMQKYAKVHTIIHQHGTSKVLFFLTLNQQILKVCRENPGISVVHFNDGLMAAMCLNHRGYSHLKRVVTVHGLDVVFPNRIYKKNILPEYRNYDLIIAVSRATANACTERGIPQEKIIVISNGVDASIADNGYTAADLDVIRQYGLDIQNKRLLVCMGRAVKRKGFSWLVKNIIPQLKGDFTLAIIGPFPQQRSLADKVIGTLPPKLARQVTLFLGWPTDEHELRSLLLKPQFKDKVKHLGKLPLDHLLKVVSAADAFLMPNIPVSGDLEGFGLVCLEACLCGTKVFASDLEGIKDVISHNNNGYLLPAGDIAAWTAALNLLIDQPGAYGLQPNEIKEYSLKKFGWDKMVHEYLQSFKTLVQEPEAIYQD